MAIESVSGYVFQRGGGGWTTSGTENSTSFFFNGCDKPGSQKSFFVVLFIGTSFYTEL